MIKYFLTIQLLLAFSLVDCMQQQKTYGKSRSTSIFSDLSNVPAPAPWKPRTRQTRPVAEEPQAKRRKTAAKQTTTTVNDDKELEKFSEKYRSADGVILLTEREKKYTDFPSFKSTDELDRFLITGDEPITFSSELTTPQKAIIQKGQEKNSFATLNEYNQFLQKTTTNIIECRPIRSRESRVPAYIYHEAARPLLKGIRTEYYGTPLRTKE